MITLYERQPFVLLAGNQGFGALEPLRDVMGDYFLTAGVAEQNMVTMAAGLAGLGFLVWVYSCAPFCYARPFEQIRNDVCMHGLPVVLVMVVVGWRFFLHEPDGPASLRELRVLNPAAKVSFSPDEWQALLYLRKNAPPDAVIMSNKYRTAYFFPFSGLAGQAAFLEWGGNVVDEFAMRQDPEDNRLAIINTLWTTTELAIFCNTIAKTKATLVIEYAEAPLQVSPSACLRRWWQGPAGQVTIWQVPER